MKEYKLNSTSANKVKDKLIQAFIFMNLIVITAVINIFKNQYLPFAIILLIVSSIRFVYQMKDEKRRLLSYTIILDNDRIIRKKEELIDVELSKNDISTIVYNNSFGLVVNSETKKEFIFVPNDLKEFNEVKSILESWKKFDINKNKIRKTNILSLYSLQSKENTKKTFKKTVLKRFLIGVGIYILTFIIIVAIVQFAAIK